MKLIPTKEQLRDGWDGPFHLRFLIFFALLSFPIYYAIHMIISLILFKVFYDDGYQYWELAFNLSLAFVAFVIIEMLIYKWMHRMNYLHYCKTLLIAQVFVVAGYFFMLNWASNRSIYN